MESPDSKKGWFLRLPPEIRLNIYERVLALDESLSLIKREGEEEARLARSRIPHPKTWNALLYTNHTISAEASEVLYSRNQFTVSDPTLNKVDVLKRFLDRIGPVNAGRISHLYIPFPVQRIGTNIQPDRIVVREDVLGSLKACRNLATLELGVLPHLDGLAQSSDGSIRTVNVREALTVINGHVRAVSSMMNVLVKIYSGGVAPAVLECMKDMGWEVHLFDWRTGRRRVVRRESLSKLL